jgi:hypothetical protein
MQACIRLAFTMRLLYDVQEVNPCRSYHICLSVRLHDSTENRWADSDEIWYGRYTIGAYSKIVLFDFIQSVTPTWRTNKLVRWDRQ